MQGVNQIWRRDGEALIEVVAPAETNDGYEFFHAHPALLDACLQGIWTTLDLNHKKSYMPMNLERLVLLRQLPLKVFSHIHLREKSGDNLDMVIGDVVVMDEQGSVVAQINGLYFRQISDQMLPEKREWDDWFYEVNWQLQSTEDSVPLPKLPLASIEDIAHEINSRVQPLSVEHHLDRYGKLVPQLENFKRRLYRCSIARARTQLRSRATDRCGRTHFHARHR